MYIPKEYENNDEQQHIEFIKKNSFGTIYSQRHGVAHATHLPFLVERDEAGQLYLVSHLSRANPQWQDLEGEVLITFLGPHTYVTPTWYEADGFVPTWDYISVHVYGEFIRVDDAGLLRSIMDHTIRNYESNMLNPWHGVIPDFVYERLIKGVVGFKIKINKIEGQWKLHQDHSEERRRNVIRHLRETKDRDAIQIADAIEQMMKSE